MVVRPASALRDTRAERPRRRSDPLTDRARISFSRRNQRYQTIQFARDRSIESAGTRVVVKLCYGEASRGQQSMDIVKGNMGWIEVIVGPMFSGKSEELIRRLRRAEIARKRVQIFKPAIDQRYSVTGIVSHSGLEIQSAPVRDAHEIVSRINLLTEVVGIDEAQFLGEGLVVVCRKLAEAGKRVIVSGLEMDYLGRPFEPMPHLLTIAEEITKLLAICIRCGNPAVHTQRLVHSDQLIVVGAEGMYEARCRRCFEPEVASLERRINAVAAAAK
jgi:thymidine kinase